MRKNDTIEINKFENKSFQSIDSEYIGPLIKCQVSY